MKERNIVHCKDGGKVIIEGDRVEVYLTGPVVVTRKQFSSMFHPREEVRRTLQFSSPAKVIEGMLEEAFRAVPMTIHREREE